MRRLSLGAVAAWVLLACIASYALGMVSARNEWFPIPQLRALKQGVVQDPGYSAHYHDRRTFFEQLGAGRYDAVFVGDSLIAEGHWPDLFPAIKVANRGIGGDRTDGLLDRLNNVLATAAPRVFVAIGINDFLVGKNVDEAFRNYEQIVTRLVAAERRVFLQSTLLAGEQRADVNARISELNRRLRGLAEQTDGVEYLDLNARLAPAGILEARYTLDGIHLNVEGYRAWRDLVAPHLEPCGATPPESASSRNAGCRTAGSASGSPPR
jgi:lysophospholipase L1-like esterase